LGGLRLGVVRLTHRCRSIRFWAIVCILTLAGKQYQEVSFSGSQLIVSLAFPGLKLTAEQVLSAGR
jgi:hypothetical protein